MVSFGHFTYSRFGEVLLFLCAKKLVRSTILIYEIDSIKDIKDVFGNIDAPYGLKGFAAPWKNDLMEGGAQQIVTPLSGTFLERIGIIPKY